MKAHAHRGNGICTFTNALFVITKNCQQPKKTSTHEVINSGISIQWNTPWQENEWTFHAYFSDSQNNHAE